MGGEPLFGYDGSRPGAAIEDPSSYGQCSSHFNARIIRVFYDRIGALRYHGYYSDVIMPACISAANRYDSTLSHTLSFHQKLRHAEIYLG